MPSRTEARAPATPQPPPPAPEGGSPPPTCLHRVVARFDVDLHPSKLHDVRSGVQEHLDALLMRHSDELEGVVLCVGPFTVLSHEAAVSIYFPLCRVRVRAPLLVFRPAVGALVTGRVTKVGADYIGLLVLGVLNASIPRSHVRPELVCRPAPPPLRWHSTRHPGHTIEVGSHVRFHVAGTQEQGAFFGICGSLKAKGTGCVAFLGAAGRGGKGAKGAAAEGAAAAEAGEHALSTAKRKKKHKEGKEGKKEKKHKKRKEGKVEGGVQKVKSKAKAKHGDKGG